MIRPTRSNATRATARTEAFTDGVFAIAATLLVLDLSTETLGAVKSDVQLWEALAGQWLPFMNFAISFALLCILWMTHVSQFAHVTSVDATMVWLNNIRLLLIVIVPFSTRMVTEYSNWHPGRILLPINFLVAILVAWFQWQWAVHKREEIIPDLSRDDAVAYGRGNLSALLLSAGVVVLAWFVGSIAFALFFFDGLLTRLLRGKGD